MKILKITGIIVLGIIVLIAILGFIAPKEYAVEREVVIDQSVEKIFDYTLLLKNQANYSKWATMDPDAKVSYRGTDGEVGFVSRWESENPDVGVGEQEIVKITANERIDYELRFFEPWESTDNAYLAFEPKGATQTVVKWGFNGKSPFPMSIMLLFMDMEQMLGDDLQTGLDNLKKLMEALPDEPEAVIPMEEVMTDSLSN